MCKSLLPAETNVSCTDMKHLPTEHLFLFIRGVKSHVQEWWRLCNYYHDRGGIESTSQRNCDALVRIMVENWIFSNKRYYY